MTPENSYLIDKIDEERSIVTDRMVSGSAADYAEYRRLVGVIQGLALARSIIKDLAERMEKNDE